jgi:hypothetical protein
MCRRSIGPEPACQLVQGSAWRNLPRMQAAGMCRLLTSQGACLPAMRPALYSKPTSKVAVLQEQTYEAEA